MSQDHQQHQNGNDFVLLLDAVTWCRITSALFSCCAAAAAAKLCPSLLCLFTVKVLVRTEKEKNIEGAWMQPAALVATSIAGT